MGSSSGPSLRPSRLIPILILLVLATLAGWYILSTPGLKPMVVSIYEPAIISAEDRILDVGQVETDSKVEKEFILYNKGGQHLRIKDVETSCGCTVADISKRVIAPGDFSRLKVTMDTSIKLGKVRKKITVLSNDPNRPELALFLTGDVIPKKMDAHQPITLAAKDQLVLFKGQCATCHVQQGVGKTGKALFVADCAMCHGMNGQGHGSAGVSLLKGNWEDDSYRRQMRTIIAEGSPHSPQMPPFSKKQGGPLNEDEIDSLVSFLKFQNLQNKMGLLNQDTAEVEDEAAFRQALNEPH